MPLLAVVCPSCDTPGIYWHKPSRQYLCHVGYHEVTVIDENGLETRKRVQSTQYLGTCLEEEACIAKYNAIREEWKWVVAEERKKYEAEQRRRKLLGLPPLGRFKPNWPTVHAEPAPLATALPQQQPLPAPLAPAPRPIRVRVAQTTHPTKDELMDLTLEEAKERYLALYKRRIGLMNGKGINENTYAKFAQNLTLALALNETYARPTRPIDVRKRLGDLVLDDYEAFVHFWCNKRNISGRGGLNYIRAFKQMIDHLKVPTPEGYAEAFSVKVPGCRKIARYDPDVLRKLLNCTHERARLFSFLCLNCGFYAVDIVRLRPEHITDAEGNPYRGGDMFITKRREKTAHQNDFTTTCYLWPETQALMLKHKAPKTLYGTYFLSKQGSPYHVKTPSGLIEQVIRESGLQGKFSVKQFRKVGASQIKALADSDAMHMYKANAIAAEDKPYLLEDFSRLTNALKKFRDKLITDKVL